MQKKVTYFISMIDEFWPFWSQLQMAEQISFLDSIIFLFSWVYKVQKLIKVNFKAATTRQ